MVSYPVKRVDATLVYDEAMRWMKHAPFEVRKAAEKVEIQAALAREAQSAKRRGLAGSDEVPTSLFQEGKSNGVVGAPGGRRGA